ncbi:MAG: class I SAM-dependent methyltransferase [Anaerolineae bacterium]|nr:class I SAM-dependent methyltransferase [Anaerolineae bacterium]
MSNDPVAPRPSPFLADLFIPERTVEIAFWTGLAMGYGRVVVNWHCGTGELALGLAKNGLRVVGVDADPEAIDAAQAREKSAANDEEMMLTWLCREPRLVSLPGSADFGVLSGEILGNYLAEDQRLGLLHNLYHHLRPGGAVGLTVPLAPASGVVRSTSISGPLRRLPKGIFARRVSTFNYDSVRALLEGHDEVMVRLPDGEQHFEESYVRHLYTPDEVFALLRQAGFIAIGMWGGWDGRPLRQANGWFIVRAERPLNREVGINPER